MLANNKSKSEILDTNLYRYLSENGDYTRTELVKKTGIARSTLYDSLHRLIAKGKVKKYTEEIENRSPGRPKIFFHAI